MPGFHKGKRNTISSGDWDGDGVKNRGDCNAFDFRKQDGGEPFSADRDIDSIELSDQDIIDNHLTKVTSGGNNFFGSKRYNDCENCGAPHKNQGSFCNKCISRSRAWGGY
jgi:hypothetical protein